MATDIATRVYNHTFRIDPAIRTLLDTDFYKLLMLQMIWKMHRERRVTFQLVNRTASVRLAEIVEERELVDQLDHARTLSLAKNELIWLAGNTFYGTRHIFEPDFMEWLAVFRLPEYELTRRDGAMSAIGLRLLGLIVAYVRRSDDETGRAQDRPSLRRLYARLHRLWSGAGLLIVSLKTYNFRRVFARFEFLDFCTATLFR